MQSSAGQLGIRGGLGVSAGRNGQDISLESGGEAIAAYLATPASGRGPGVVVIQEWWGLVDHIRDVCDRLAREGFVALAPDLYRGEQASDPDDASRLMMDLEIPRASGDLAAAVEALLNRQEVDGARVGCIGFCMGGQLALSAACEIERIGAVVDCYGIHPNVTPDLSALKAPVFGVFAENDAFISPDVARKLESDLQAAGSRAHFNVYMGVEHAFMNDSRPDVYDAPVAAEAWDDLLAFMRAELR
jgi:carboxymethylenebutenolidase